MNNNAANPASSSNLSLANLENIIRQKTSASRIEKLPLNFSTPPKINGSSLVTEDYITNILTEYIGEQGPPGNRGATGCRGPKGATGATGPFGASASYTYLVDLSSNQSISPANMYVVFGNTDITVNITPNINTVYQLSQGTFSVNFFMRVSSVNDFTICIQSSDGTTWSNVSNTTRTISASNTLQDVTCSYFIQLTSEINYIRFYINGTCTISSDTGCVGASATIFQIA